MNRPGRRYELQSPKPIWRRTKTNFCGSMWSKPTSTHLKTLGSLADVSRSLWGKPIHRNGCSISWRLGGEAVHKGYLWWGRPYAGALDKACNLGWCCFFIQHHCPYPPLAEIPLTWQEEPMEMDAIKVTLPAELSLSISEMASGLSALREEVSFLKKQIQCGSSAAADERVARSMGPRRGERRNISRRKCFKCGTLGHIKRDCPEVRFKKVEAAIAAFSSTSSEK